jgi:calcineurin-like phosphoesterase family protein
MTTITTKEATMSAIYYTSDLHLGHRLVAGHRGFGEDTEAHDAEIADHWLTTIREDDIVYVLGDLAVSNPTRALDILADLPGRKRLVTGNHDPVAPQHREAHKWVEAYAAVFEWVTPFARRRFAGHDVLLSHFPYWSDHSEVPRHTQWRLRDEGGLLLHGHTHSTVIRTSEREVHIGWDAWRRLVPEHEVAALFDTVASAAV